MTKSARATIYQDYFAGQLDEAGLVEALDRIQEKTIKEDGVIYTPDWIVREMIDLAGPKPTDHILEPSCGHGIFLFGLLKFMHDKHKLSGGDLHAWFCQRVTGVDIQEKTAQELRVMLAAYFKKHFSLDKAPEDFTNIVCADGLLFESKHSVDLVIGNPPYIRTKNIESEYLKFLRKNFASCQKGNIDIYYAFWEKYTKLADTCFITPNGFLTNVSGGPLRFAIQKQITHLVDFKDRLVFKDARTYTCVIKTSKNAKKQSLFYANDLGGDFLVKNTGDFFRSKKDSGHVPVVLSGIATLCDKVFLVKEENGVFFAEQNGKKFEIEKGVVVPYVKLTKVRKQKNFDTDFMIYPYDQNKKILSEDLLKTKFPKAYTYLLGARDKLNKRDKGKTSKYEAWYAYGRKQGLHDIKDQKLVAIPQMIGAKSLPRRIDVANLLSEYGRFVFTSGFLIPETKDTRKICKAILSERFLSFAKDNGKPWPGKDELYYSLTTKQIKQFIP